MLDKNKIQYFLFQWCWINQLVPSSQARLTAAALQRLRRMCAIKKKRKTLEVPEWVRKEYQSGCKNTLAKIYMDANWSKARFGKDFICSKNTAIKC